MTKAKDYTLNLTVRGKATLVYHLEVLEAGERAPTTTTVPPTTTTVPLTTVPPTTTTVPLTTVPPTTTTVPLTTVPPTTTTVPPTTTTVPSSQAIALGVYTADSPEPAGFQAFGQLVGRTPAIVMWYQSWSEPLFYYSQMGMVAQDGATPLITWAPELSDGYGVPLSQIVAGNYDAYIQAQAEAAASWNVTIYVRFAHEMNLSSSPYGPDVNGNTPALFVEAWRHVVSIFRTAGATNVRWVWSPNVDCEGACPFQAFYPGDSWVDWVALDGYNYSTVDDMPWMSFEDLFQSSYNQMAALTTKPMMVAETASTEVGGDKAAWITSALTETLPEQMPLIRALIWFNVNKETDWSVNSSSASLSAFAAAVDGPLFAGALPS